MIANLKHILLPVAILAAGAFYGFTRPAGAVQAPQLLGYTVKFSTTEGATINQPVDDQWYAPGNAHLTVPAAGTWRLGYRVCTYVSRNRNDDGTWDFGTVGAVTTLSTSPTAEADPEFRAFYRVGGANRNAAFILDASKVVVVRQPTTYYLLAKQSEGGMGELQFAASNANCPPTVIQAERVGPAPLALAK